MPPSSMLATVETTNFRRDRTVMEPLSLGTMLETVVLSLRLHDLNGRHEQRPSARGQTLRRKET